MKVEQKTLDEIRPYEHNPRLNDEAVDVVAASIREFGFRQPMSLMKTASSSLVTPGTRRLKNWDSKKSRSMWPKD